MFEHKEGFTPECDQFVGKILQFIPIEGWGWSGTHPIDPAGPSPFRALLKELPPCQGVKKGGLAIIQEPGHPFEGWWVDFRIRHKGALCDFHTLCVYTITISPHSLDSTAPSKPPYFDGFTNILTPQDYQEYKAVMADQTEDK